MGSALAYWLTRLEPTVSVMVLERDPTYSSASSALSAASIRQQFTTAVNIRISQASIELLRGIGELLETDGIKPDIGLNEAGYLYLADGASLDRLRQAHAIQARYGAEVALLSPAQLAAEFPWLETCDLSAGTLGLRGEGWFDGYLLLTAFARKARSQGARYARGEVVGVEIRQSRVEAVVLADGSRVQCGRLINAAGPWARSLAKLAGVDLPVFARRRTVYVISCGAELPLAAAPAYVAWPDAARADSPRSDAGRPDVDSARRDARRSGADSARRAARRSGADSARRDARRPDVGPADSTADGRRSGPARGFPLLIDPSGFWIRPEGSRFIAGVAPAAVDPDDAPLEPECEAFESQLWPALAARVPAFEAARLERAWAGYYDMNVFDHNGIVGFHPEVANLGLMNGFSGHGMQQGPVVGRGMAELILHGRFTTVDLTPLSYERIVAGLPLRELNVIG
jgi:glycine/D-amino acid oxidase-like deaminating enzyme